MDMNMSGDLGDLGNLGNLDAELGNLGAELSVGLGDDDGDLVNNMRP